MGPEVNFRIVCGRACIRVGEKVYGGVMEALGRGFCKINVLLRRVSGGAPRFLSNLRPNFGRHRFFTALFRWWSFWGGGGRVFLVSALLFASVSVLYPTGESYPCHLRGNQLRLGIADHIESRFFFVLPIRRSGLSCTALSVFGFWATRKGCLGWEKETRVARLGAKKRISRLFRFCGSILVVVCVAGLSVLFYRLEESYAFDLRDKLLPFCKAGRTESGVFFPCSGERPLLGGPLHF